MDELPGGRDPRTGDCFRHPTGATEAVYAVVDGRILTIREYPDAHTFARHNGEAHYEGVDQRLADAPDPLTVAREGPDAWADYLREMRGSDDSDGAADPAGSDQTDDR